MENSNNLVTYHVNNRPFQTLKGTTILQACEQAGVLIPRFCYHDRLSIAGNCRMCLVQVEKSAKPVASCALEVISGMKIFTNTALVKKAREGVLEFLLANHPLDCPICDQGGECDLQDQALVFGNDRGRFYETKRAVADKDWGHLVKTVMTRCIHCTRCQRFSAELAGKVEIAMVGRGGKSEITNFLGSAVLSEVSGNVIDLCPVGALTSKPYAFTARPWELAVVPGLDLTDSLGSNLSFQVSNQRVMRVLPLLNQELNEEWLSNRARFSYDGFRLQRLIKPLFYDVEARQLSKPSLLLSSLFYFGPFFSSSGLFGGTSLYSSYYLSKLFSFFPSTSLDSDFRHKFSLPFSYSSLSNASLLVLVGTYLKRDLPLLLVRIRFEQSKRSLPVFVFGISDFNLPIKHVGVTTQQFQQFVEGRHPLSTALVKAVAPFLLVDSLAFASNLVSLASYDLLLAFNSKLKAGILPQAGASFNNFSEIGGLLPPLSKPANINFSLFTVNHLLRNTLSSRFPFSIAVNSHGLDSLIRPNLFIFPVKSDIESNGFYINLEGRVQASKRVFFNNSVDSSSVTFSKLLALFGVYNLKPSRFFSELLLNQSSTSRTTAHSRSFLKTFVLPFFHTDGSVYQTTPSSLVSPHMAKSELALRQSNTSSFPLV